MKASINPATEACAIVDLLQQLAACLRVLAALCEGIRLCNGEN